MKPIVKMIPIESIITTKRKRPLKDFEALKNSIKDVGLLNPITIYRNAILVAGYHRLEACKSLGWKEIPAMNIEDDNLKAEQAQIDENIIRNKLTALEMAEQLMRRKEIYEIKYPETTKLALSLKNLKQGNEHSSRNGIIPLRGTSFVDDTAFQIGKSKSTIQKYVKIGVSIPKEIRDLIRGSSIEDRLTDLLRLSRIDDIERQRELVEGIINGEANTIAGLLRKEKQGDKPTLPDMTKPTVPTRLFKNIYNQLIDLQIKYSKLEVELEGYKESMA